MGPLPALSRWVGAARPPAYARSGEAEGEQQAVLPWPELLKRWGSALYHLFLSLAYGATLIGDRDTQHQSLACRYREGGLRASTERWTGSHTRPRRDQVGVVSSRLRDQLTPEQHASLDNGIAARRGKKQQETDIGKLRAKARPRP
ncbi:hypothetical protein T492DRAFT_831296 [Pavlovales sp. CCMP2436]|nr:hypothetical protein T492DRAFT_831296 [Pavlovales sp. CCMP2436]